MEYQKKRGSVSRWLKRTEKKPLNHKEKVNMALKRLEEYYQVKNKSEYSLPISVEISPQDKGRN